MDYRTTLRAELARRTQTNRSYSLRAFARALDLDVGALSRVLAKKKSLTPTAAARVAARLGLAPEAQSAFVASAALGKTAAPAMTQEPVDTEIFHIIGDWYHYAILELSLTAGFRSDVRWISKALGITQLEAKLAVERLLATGLLRDEDGVWRKTTRNITTADKHKTTAAHRAHQAQILDKAKYSLENDPFAERSMTGMTMAIDPDKLPAARALIEEFMARLCDTLEAGAQKQVYQLGINLFPLQKKETLSD